MLHCPTKLTSGNIFTTIILILCTIIYTDLSAQDTLRRVGASRIESGMHITIDGNLAETAWSMAEHATGFVSYEPHFGHEPALNTLAKFCYDDYGLYIGLEMLDHQPDSIFRDLSVRDDMGNADWIGLLLSPSNDGQNGFRFQVSATGVQYDAKIIMDGNDASWDAVWYSKTGVSARGWVVEMLIPWSAIRFPNQPEQIWDMNLIREVRRHRELSTWNPVDKHKHGFLTQSGKLSGLKNLETPVRLALLPYASGYIQKLSNAKELSYTFNAGMDVKYGIMNNYTIDLTLIPDFGQVRSDDEIYNFSPHEVRYNENRPFFMEGTELFDKAGIFYSRRIGQRPVGYYDVEKVLKEGETIETNPQESQLINATKFSGRNNQGFAVGLFNAMTGASHAVIRDSMDQTYQYQTQHFTNYNMVVLDQSIANNSFLHLANTNLYRNDYMANVTAASFKMKTKKQKYAISGDGAISTRVSPETQYDPGFKYGINFSKISGNVRWDFGHSAISADYNPNDMGYEPFTNIAEAYGSVGYYRFNPVGNVLNYNVVLWANYNMLQQDFRRTYGQINLRGIVTTKNRLTLGGTLSSIPTDRHDYYEARIPGRVYIQSGHSFINLWSSPDYRKKFLVDLGAGGWLAHDGTQKGYSISAGPRLRLNSRSLVLLNVNFETELPSRGYVGQVSVGDSTVLLFGERNISTLITALSTQYIVNPISSFSLRIRHYWVTTAYNRFFQLPESGYLEPTTYAGNRDFTFNIFNIDLGYSWNFAPGSYLNVVYKNAILHHNEGKVQQHYIRNWGDLIDSPANNSLSVKLIYYIDYETIRTGYKTKRT
jgi:hypothetical protein